MYGNGSCGLKLTDAVEFYGVLTIDAPLPAPDVATGAGDATTATLRHLLCEDLLLEGLNKPTFDRVPKLHCIGAWPVFLPPTEFVDV